LTNDFVAEKIGHANFQEIKELDFPNSLIRTVDIGPAEIFKNLRRLVGTKTLSMRCVVRPF